MKAVRSKTIFLTNNAVNSRAIFHGPSVEDAGSDAGRNETLRVVVKALFLDVTAVAALPADLGHVQLRSSLASTCYEPFSPKGTTRFTCLQYSR